MQPCFNPTRIFMQFFLAKMGLSCNFSLVLIFFLHRTIISVFQPQPNSMYKKQNYPIWCGTAPGSLFNKFIGVNKDVFRLESTNLFRNQVNLCICNRFFLCSKTPLLAVYSLFLFLYGSLALLLSCVESSVKCAFLSSLESPVAALSQFFKALVFCVSLGFKLP